MPSPVVGLIGASVGGSLVQARAAGRAADAQSAAARAQMDVQERMFLQSRDDLAPYRDSGVPAMNALNYYLGIGERPGLIGGTPAEITTVPGERRGFGVAGPSRYSVNGQVFNTMDEAQAYANANPVGGTPFVGFQETPGYQFAFNEGMRAIDASAASRGMLRSGATMQAQQERATGLANQEFGNYLARLSGQATLGSNAAAQTATVNTNNAQMQSNALANMGNAQAAGFIGQGNAFNSGINNGIGLWQYQNMMGGFPRN